MFELIELIGPDLVLKNHVVVYHQRGKHFLDIIALFSTVSFGPNVSQFFNRID